MNFLVCAFIGPNGNYQWIPCETRQEAERVANIVWHADKPIIYQLMDGKKIPFNRPG